MTDVLAGKTAVVTGAGQGIGLAVAQRLAQDGATVVGAARTITDDLAEVAKTTVAVDLAAPDGPQQLVDRAVAEHGGVDVVVNNVGAFVARTDGFAAITDEQWQQTFELNLFSAIRTIRAALPSLLERKGSIVNVTSVGARLPQPPIVDYSAAKAGLANLTLSLAEELGPQGVQVAAVAPGPTLTPAWRDPDGFGAALAEASDTPLEEFLDSFPEQAGLTTGRLTEPDEVAAVVALLASGAVPSAHGSEWVMASGQAKQH